MRFLEKLGFEHKNNDELNIAIFRLALFVFLFFGPLFFTGFDSVVTMIGRKAAEQEPMMTTAMFLGAALIWAFFLYGNYRDSRSKKFPMEEMIDRNIQALITEGKSADSLERFRLFYRRRQYVSIVLNALLASTLTLYYGVIVTLIVLIHQHINVIKGNCPTGLTFSLLEKIYAQQFLKDLPFGIADIFNIYGKCSPNTEEFAIRLFTSCANALHWALLIGVISFVWGEQIKRWFMSRQNDGSAP